RYYAPFLNIIFNRIKGFYNESELKSGKIKIEFVGSFSCSMLLEKQVEQWIEVDTDEFVDTIIYIDQQIAWLIFSGSIFIGEAQMYYQIIGDQHFAIPVLKYRMQV